MTLPRYLLDSGIVQQLVNVDTSFGADLRDGKVLVQINYRRGEPLGVQVIRVEHTMSLKVHVKAESA